MSFLASTIPPAPSTTVDLAENTKKKTHHTVPRTWADAYNSPHNYDFIMPRERRDGTTVAGECGGSVCQLQQYRAHKPKFRQNGRQEVRNTLTSLFVSDFLAPGSTARSNPCVTITSPSHRQPSCDTAQWSLYLILPQNVDRALCSSSTAYLYAPHSSLLVHVGYSLQLTVLCCQEIVHIAHQSYFFISLSRFKL